MNQPVVEKIKRDCYWRFDGTDVGFEAEFNPDGYIDDGEMIFRGKRQEDTRLPREQ